MLSFDQPTPHQMDAEVNDNQGEDCQPKYVAEATQGTLDLAPALFVG